MFEPGKLMVNFHCWYIYWYEQKGPSKKVKLMKLKGWWKPSSHNLAVVWIRYFQSGKKNRIIYMVMSILINVSKWEML